MTTSVPMSIWTRVPWQAFAVAALVLPALTVFAARELLPAAGPKQAQAQPTTTANAGDARPAVISAGSVNEADVAMLKVFRAQTAATFGPSPIAAPVIKSQQRAARPQRTDAPPREVEIKLPVDVQLTSVMRSHGQNLAMIGRKLRRVGDSVAPGWELTAIDADAGTATVRHTSGLVEQLALRRKQAQPPLR